MGYLEFKFVQMKDHGLFQREIIPKKRKIHYRNLKNPLGTKNGIQVYSNEVSRPFSREDKCTNEMGKNTLPKFENLFL